MSNEEKCTALLWSGPGHQTRRGCLLTYPHLIHRSNHQNRNVYWEGQSGFTGVFNEPPSLFSDEYFLEEIDKKTNIFLSENRELYQYIKDCYHIIKKYFTEHSSIRSNVHNNTNLKIEQLIVVVVNSYKSTLEMLNILKEFDDHFFKEFLKNKKTKQFIITI